MKTSTQKANSSQRARAEIDKLRPAPLPPSVT